MKLTLAILADYASIDKSNGKINVLGIFGRLFAAGFPVRHDRLAVVINIRPDLLEDPDGHSFSLRLVNADDQELLFRADGPIQFAQEEGGIRPDVSLVLELNNLVFPRPGEYRFEIWIDDENTDFIPLDVVNTPPPE